MKGIVRPTYALNFRFLVLTGGESICFSKISGIEITMEQEEIFEGGKNGGPHILFSPHKKNPPLVLERGILPNNSWLSKLRPGMRLGTWLQVVLLDEQGNPMERTFGIDDGTVVKWEISGLDALGNSIVVEKMEIAHDGILYQ